ncbi:putative membrane protein YfkQ [Alicyclobacillus hesperidum]|uniref:Membrane protein YfkQ n=1 Tax=Alicyclobacillus hesperidum TaxID=89784 RepID=A0A1H2R2A3_9BACL|nr:putative membrane protein YfkQ [Alicyclobacillus hesperidum]SDW13318.1 spore germination protein KA [Alicyclobacillus hesperidum]
MSGRVLIRRRRRRPTESVRGPEQQGTELDASTPLEIEGGSSYAASCEIPISDHLHDNLTMMLKVFSDCSDLQVRHLCVGHKRDACMLYLSGLVNPADLSEEALRPLIYDFQASDEHVIDWLSPDKIRDEGVLLARVGRADTFRKAIDGIVDGRAALFVDGVSQAVLLSTSGPERRSISEPETESVVRGPREGFTEDLSVNIALLRHKIRTPQLKAHSFTLGTYTKTAVLLVYIEDLADPKVIAEAKRRISSIEIDGVLESGYIEELIEDQPMSPFPQFQYSERPDTIAAQLLEGRFAIFTEGTPFVLIAPVTWWQFVQASEDYYERFFLVYLVRVLRYISLFLALFLPAMYIAVTTYHQDMLPTSLVMSVAAARESIPFPAIIEALIMELTFEALREAGIRLPKAVGQAVSILGALVIGQAAVEAGIVSAPMVIIVAITGIASFTLPRYNAAIAIRLLRFPMMLLAAVLGMFGIVIGVMWISIHLCKLRSFGVPYLSGLAPYKRKEVKDLFFRPPWWKMVFRPSSFAHHNRKRMAERQMPGPDKRSGSRGGAR